MWKCLDISNREGGDDLATESIMDVTVELETGLGDHVATVNVADDWSGNLTGIHGMHRWVKRYLERFANEFEIVIARRGCLRCR
jgi:hypothetical protein